MRRRCRPDTAGKSSISSGPSDLWAQVSSYLVLSFLLLLLREEMLECVVKEAMIVVMVLGFSGGLTGLLWAVSRVPWVGVFAMGVGLGVYMLKCWGLMDALENAEKDRVELEKQVVALRTTVDNMARARLEMEVDRRHMEYYSRCRKRHAAVSRGGLNDSSSSL